MLPREPAAVQDPRFKIKWRKSKEFREGGMPGAPGASGPASDVQNKMAVLREFQEFWEFGGESRAQCSSPQFTVH
jgi:hypothetical protein